jgi:hypothetical protein
LREDCGWYGWVGGQQGVEDQEGEFLRGTRQRARMIERESGHRKQANGSTRQDYGIVWKLPDENREQ